MDDIEIISGFFVVNSGVLLFVAFLIIVSVLLKIWTTLRAMPTLKDLEMQRAAEWAWGRDNIFTDFFKEDKSS